MLAPDVVVAAPVEMKLIKQVPIRQPAIFDVRPFVVIIVLANLKRH